MKFTDEELSRILSAHAGRQLSRAGEFWPAEVDRVNATYACVIQAGKLIANNEYPLVLDRDLVGAFDKQYRRGWTVGRFLRWLESQGVA